MRTATPPITPPATAPAGADDDDLTRVEAPVDDDVLGAEAGEVLSAPAVAEVSPATEVEEAVPGPLVAVAVPDFAVEDGLLLDPEVTELEGLLDPVVTELDGLLFELGVVDGPTVAGGVFVVEENEGTSASSTVYMA